MAKLHDILEQCRIKPGKKVRLKDFPPDWAGDPDAPKEQRKRMAEEVLSESVDALAKQQSLLYASNSWAVLVIVQAMDAAGKDSVVSHVLSGVNPQGCQVYSFKAPSAEELDHTFLWRCMKVLPERGRIGIFNRSYYEEVLIAKVHPHILANQRLPSQLVHKNIWEERYEDINNFEKHLARNGVKILKFFLHVSKEEQKQRFLERINNPEKNWKFAADDVRERGHWDEYMEAYEDALTATNTEWAPWRIVPADRKWVTRAIVAATLVEAIQELDLNYPELSKVQRADLTAAKAILEAEKE
ncbi:MAG TPA: polyphosphate kinase 2 family protein, partial [Pirellulales bacterium]